MIRTTFRKKSASLPWRERRIAIWEAFAGNRSASGLSVVIERHSIMLLRCRACYIAMHDPNTTRPAPPPAIARDMSPLSCEIAMLQAKPFWIP